jgi:hypothetical protein
MPVVYTLQHSRVLSHGDDDVKFIGVYRTRDAAEAAVRRLIDKPGFSSYPTLVERDSESDEGFHIGAYELDEDHWAEGFITMDEAMA